MESPAIAPRIAACKLARAMTVLFLCLTAAVSLTWGHAKLLSQDEMYEFQTDSLPSLGQLIHVQKTWPISLDPLAYHALSHAAMMAFGVGAFAQRLPALVGFLLMQICLFFFVRNLAGERAGMVAATVPALTAALFYSAEGRPYGLMLGLYALALWCWQVAAQGDTSPNGEVDLAIPRRRWALIGLAFALAATINAHYFGVLLLVPVCAAEGYRTLLLRRLDWPIVASIGAGMASFLGARPFMKAAAEFRKNYYNGGSVSLHDITRAYRSIFVDYTRTSPNVQHIAMVALVVFAALLAWGCVRRMRVPASPDLLSPSSADWVVLLTLAALPFCGYLMARFVTHSIEVRYVLGALVAIAAMAAIAVEPWLRRDGVYGVVVATLGLGILCTGAAQIHAERRRSAERLSSLILPDEVKKALATNLDGRLHIQDMGAFEEDRYYEPDPDVRSRMTLVYSADEELRWNRHDTMALTAQHMQRFTDLPVTSYEELKKARGNHIFVLFHSGWDWTDEAFKEDSANVTPLGQAMRGDAVAASFQPH